MTSLTAVPSRTSEIIVSWEPPDGSYQDAYRVLYSLSESESTWKKKHDLNGLEKTVSELTPGNTYTFEVIAISGNQMSAGITTTATVCKCH